MARKLFTMVVVVAGLALGGIALATVPAGGTRPEAVAAPAAQPEAPAAAREARPGGEEKQESLISQEVRPGPFIITILIFVSLFLVLSRTAWKPILAGLKNREQAIRDSIEAAQRAKAEAERTTRDLETKMAEVQRQAAQQLAQAKADALKLADSIRAQAEAESVAMKDRTMREIDAAKQQAVAEINSHAAELATAVAGKILQRSVTADDHQRLVEESLAEMARKN